MHPPLSRRCPPWSIPSGKPRHVFGCRCAPCCLRLPLHTKYPPIAMTWNEDGSRLALLSSGGDGGAHSQVAIWDTVRGGWSSLEVRRVAPNQFARGHIQFVEHGSRLLHLAGNATKRDGELPRAATSHAGLGRQTVAGRRRTRLDQATALRLGEGPAAQPWVNLLKTPRRRIERVQETCVPQTSR